MSKEFISTNFTYVKDISNIEDNVEIKTCTYLDPELIENSSIADTMTCPICCGIVLNPKCCNVCKHAFCNKCIEELKRTANAQNKTCQCPLCKANFLVSDIDPFAKRMMDSVKIKCSNVNCNTYVNFGEYDSHIKKCNKSVLICKHCKIEKPYSDMKEHFKICPEMPIKCKRCSKEIKIKYAPEHVEEHERILCKFCNNFFPIKLLDAHHKVCDKSKICEACEDRISKLDYHDKDNCFKTTIRLKDQYKKMINDQKNELTKKIEDLETKCKTLKF